MRTLKALQTSYGLEKRDVRSLVSELKQIREGTTNLPKAIIFPQFPSIAAYDNDGEEEVDVYI